MGKEGEPEAFQREATSSAVVVKHLVRHGKASLSGANALMVMFCTIGLHLSTFGR